MRRDSMTAREERLGILLARVIGPTVWITHRAERSPPVVATARPVGRPSGHSVERIAGILEDRGAAAPMDRAVDAAAAEQRRVRRVHDGVDLLLRDVALDQNDAGHASIVGR